MSKKIIAFVITLVMVLSFAVPVMAAEPRVIDTYAPDAGTACFKIADLMAGQDMDVGDLFIDPLAADNTFLVTYKISEPGWFISQVHFEAINAGDENYIYSKGGIVPGKLTVNESFDMIDEIVEFSFMYTSGAEVIGFAAHAVVEHPEVGHIETKNFSMTSGANTDLATGGDADFSLVDPWVNVDTNVNNIADCTDIASYMWDADVATSYYADNGGMVDFVQSFEIIGTPVSATLKIAADNAFAYTINDGEEVDENLAEGWRTLALGDDFGYPYMVIDPNTSGWSHVYTYDVLSCLVSGTNSFEATGVNADWNTTSWSVNPAMIIYKLCGTSELYVVDEPYQKETAWGAGIDAEGANWSKIIPIPDIDCVEVQSLLVPSTTIAGVQSQILKDGYGYCLEASGTYKFATWAPPADSGYADAKFNCREGSYIPDLNGKTPEEDYHINTDGTVWINGQAFNYILGLQIRINGNWANWEGVYNEDHIYTKDLTGAGATVLFAIYVNVYTDNSGSLTVKICQRSFVNP